MFQHGNSSMKSYSNRTKKIRYFLDTLVETSEKLEYFTIGLRSVCTFQKVYLTVTKILGHIERKVINGS